MMSSPSIVSDDDARCCLDDEEMYLYFKECYLGTQR